MVNGGLLNKNVRTYPVPLDTSLKWIKYNALVTMDISMPVQV